MLSSSGLSINPKQCWIAITNNGSHKIVVRTAYPQVPPKVEDCLTQWDQSICPARDAVLMCSDRWPPSSRWPVGPGPSQLETTQPFLAPFLAGAKTIGRLQLRRSIGLHSPPRMRSISTDFGLEPHTPDRALLTMRLAPSCTA